MLKTVFFVSIMAPLVSWMHVIVAAAPLEGSESKPGGSGNRWSSIPAQLRSDHFCRKLGAMAHVTVVVRLRGLL